MTPIYNRIGNGYNATRSADPRIVDGIVAGLDLSVGSRILDVGAGTGSYSFALAARGFEVTALEPSAVMRDQAGDSEAVTWVEGVAEDLPFPEASFDGAILILCLHHFSDPRAALAEVRRVVAEGPIVIFTYDPEALEGPWLFHYFPAFRDQIREAFPSIARVNECLNRKGDFIAKPFCLPADLKDHFVGAAWRDPSRYLDQRFRDGTSAFQLLDSGLVDQGINALALDLKNGHWDKQFGEVRTRDFYDMGYTFIVSKGEG